MFDLVHQMRARIIQSRSFSSARVLGAILFEQTMGRQVGAHHTAKYLWREKGTVPFLKVDRGLADEANGVQMMKDIDRLDDLLERALACGMCGTKMRSVVKAADARDVADVLDQQFSYTEHILSTGLVPILEAEVDIHSADKAEAEALLLHGLTERLDALAGEPTVMLKLTLPSISNFYRSLLEHPRVLRVVALSGGYPQDHACELLSQNPGRTASFSRALLEGLTHQMAPGEFDNQLDLNGAEICAAST